MRDQACRSLHWMAGPMSTANHLCFGHLIFWVVKVRVTQLCLTLCDPMDYTVHRILQAWILEWIAFPFSRGSSQPRDRIQVSHIAVKFFTSWATIWLIHAFYFTEKVCSSLRQWSLIFLASGTGFVEDSFFTDGAGGWFGDDWSTLCLLCTLYLLLLHRLHLRSLGIRSRRSGTPTKGWFPWRKTVNVNLVNSDRKIIELLALVT